MIEETTEKKGRFAHAKEKWLELRMQHGKR
jgi:hypothetical protein